jgi:hypothetical protein
MPLLGLRAEITQQTLKPGKKFTKENLEDNKRRRAKEKLLHRKIKKLRPSRGAA